jgi:hypothetical protein
MGAFFDLRFWRINLQSAIVCNVHDLRGRVSDANIAFGRAVDLLPIVFRFRALQARKRKTKNGKYHAAAGKYQLEGATA